MAITSSERQVRGLPLHSSRTSRGSVIHNLPGGVRLRESARSIVLLGDAHDQAIEQLVTVANQRFGSSRVKIRGRKDVERRLAKIAASRSSTSASTPSAPTTPSATTTGSAMARRRAKRASANRRAHHRAAQTKPATKKATNASPPPRRHLAAATAPSAPGEVSIRRCCWACLPRCIWLTGELVPKACDSGFL